MIKLKHLMIYSLVIVFILSTSVMNSSILSLIEQGLIAQESAQISSGENTHNTRAIWKSTGNESENKSDSDGLDLIYPNGGDVLSGCVTIRWVLAPEYWDENVSFSVYYSPDAGVHWIQLAFQIKESSFEWNTTLYKRWGNSFLVKIIAYSNNWEDKEVISDGVFAIDNIKIRNLVIAVIDRNEENTKSTNLIDNPAGTINSLLLQLLDLIPSLFIVSIITILGLLLYKTRSEQEAFTGFFQTSEIELLTAVKHKVIIGLDNIRNELTDGAGSREIPRLDVGPASTSLVEYFPSDIRNELLSTIKGRTVLTLIEIAYQEPDQRNPVKLARTLNIPLPTLSKDIKKLVDLQYVEPHVSAQVFRDARYRNFKISPKGFTFLSALNVVLDAVIERLKENGA